MKNCFIFVETVKSVLEDSKVADAYQFSISDSIKLYDYDPGDFRIDGLVPNDGAYIYHNESDFIPGDIDNESQDHKPVFCVDIYSSRPAAETETGYNASVAEASAAMRAAVSEIYDAIMHTTFRRIVNEQCALDSNFGDTKAAELFPEKMIHILTLKPTQNSQAVCCYRMKFRFSMTEISDQASTYTLDSINDRLHTMRDESELPE